MPYKSTGIIRAYNWDVEGEIPFVVLHLHENYFIQDEHIIYSKVIEASVVLHNYLIEEHDNVPEDWRDDSHISDVDDALSDDDELNNAIPCFCLNDHWHKQLKNCIVEKYVYT